VQLVADKILAYISEAHRAMSDDQFQLSFDLTDFHVLDNFALLARQDFNLGNAGDWFGAFRGGLYGSYARLLGVVRHYGEVHAWLPRPRYPDEVEYHLTSILFNMDSTLECLCFALNALGYAHAPSDFHAVDDPAQLKRIAPLNVFGDPLRSPPLEPVPGYAAIFPRLQQVWLARRELISRIVDLHDVSKHRQTIYVGGMSRLDPPLGFFESLNLPDDPSVRAMFWPMAEIILEEDPKSPRALRTPQPASEHVHLEMIAPQFAELVSETGSAALSDARERIRLNVTSFPTAPDAS
jgi:hypothetical protein